MCCKKSSPAPSGWAATSSVQSLNPPCEKNQFFTQKGAQKSTSIDWANKKANRTWHLLRGAWKWQCFAWCGSSSRRALRLHHQPPVGTQYCTALQRCCWLLRRTRESEQRPPDDHLCRSSPRHSTAYTTTTSLSRSGRYCESSTLDECSTWQRRNRDKRDQRNEENINRPVQGRGVAAGVTYNMITHKRMSDIWYSTAISIMNQYLSLPNGFMTVSQCPVHLYHLPLKSAIHQSKEKNCLTI